jgi:hypothetical protein
VRDLSLTYVHRNHNGELACSVSGRGGSGVPGTPDGGAEGHASGAEGHALRGAGRIRSTVITCVDRGGSDRRAVPRSASRVQYTGCDPVDKKQLATSKRLFSAHDAVAEVSWRPARASNPASTRCHDSRLAQTHYDSMIFFGQIIDYLWVWQTNRAPDRLIQR